MTKIVFFSRYENRTRGLRFSLKNLVIESLKDLGIETKYIYHPDHFKNIKDSIILFFVKPGTYIHYLDKIHFSNTNIIWNLEPFPYFEGNSGNEKFDNVRNCFKKLLADNKKYNLHHVFFFDKRQADYFDGTDSSYLPIGFHPCLSSNKSDYNSKRTDGHVLLAGIRSEFRDKCIRIVNKNLQRAGLSSRIKVVGHDSIKTFEQNKNLIYNFRLGLNHHIDYINLHIQWHRIMMYAANRVAILSQDNLDPFGFVSGKHYLNYKSLDEMCKKIIMFSKNQNRLEPISLNMFNKIKSDFLMSKLFKKSFEQILKGFI